MHRRGFLAAAVFAVTGISLSEPVSATVETPAKAVTVDVQAKAAPGQYMVGDSECACDWLWEHGSPIWRMSSKEGVRWYEDGPLSEKGRAMLLEHFGLEDMAGELPLDTIRRMSPAKLIFTRRRLEDELGPRLGDRLVAISDHPTFKVRAEDTA